MYTFTPRRNQPRTLAPYRQNVRCANYRLRDCLSASSSLPSLMAIALYIYCNFDATFFNSPSYHNRNDTWPNMCVEFHRIHRSCRHDATGTAGIDSYIRQCPPSFFPCTGRNRRHVNDLIDREYCDDCLLRGANIVRQRGVDPAFYTQCFGVRLTDIINSLYPGWGWDDLDDDLD
jgi:hypothetical protein